MSHILARFPGLDNDQVDHLEDSTGVFVTDCESRSLSGGPKLPRAIVYVLHSLHGSSSNKRTGHEHGVTLIGSEVFRGTLQDRSLCAAEPHA